MFAATPIDSTSNFAIRLSDSSKSGPRGPRRIPLQVAQGHSHAKPECQPAVDRCNHPDCRKPTITTLESNSLRHSHFVAACYARLDEIIQLVEQKKLGVAELETIRAFVAECTGAAVSRALRAHELNNRERAQLLDVVLSAAQILTRLRRSPRVGQRIPIRLLGDFLTDPRIEATVTQTVSKHGAMFNCAHPYVKGEIMDVVRLDTGHTAIARVAWHKPIAPGQHSVAIEILNSTNFWSWG